MNIRVLLWGQIKQKAATGRMEWDAPEGEALDEAVRRIAGELGGEAAGILLTEDGGIHPSVLISHNGAHVRDPAQVKLSDGDEVSLMSPIAGG